MDNLNILVEAKREYMEQLCILICPVMIEVFEDMYSEAQKLSKGRKVLMMFQNLLKDVPEWNETMARQHTENIAARCAWFRDLVAAVFVSSVKILSAVRLSSDSKKMSVKLPTNEIFIHTCYKNAAKDLYRDPYIFTDSQSEHVRNDKLYERFTTCVETTVKELIPVQQILQTYMASNGEDMLNPQDADMVEDNIQEYDEENPGEMGGGFGAPEGVEGVEGMEGAEGMEGEGMEHPMGEVEDGMEEPGGEYQEHMEQPMEEYQAPQQAAPNPFENEFRTVSTRPQQPQRSDGDLFADAADARSKKLRY